VTATLDKADLRVRLRRARQERAADERTAAAAAIASHVLALPELESAGTVTAYISRASEPGTEPLLRGLVDRGMRVLLPVLLDGLVLDWAPYAGDADLVPCALPGNASLLEPSGARLGPDGVASADVVLAPGLAVGADGTRMGFGGGCYDRALARVDAATPVAVLLYDEEVLDAVPREPHDRPVTMAVTPRRVVRFADA
jgi:5-formyltetrahydrofolate cyclo-ligase